jgi:hypothetical protein
VIFLERKTAETVAIAVAAETDYPRLLLVVDAAEATPQQRALLAQIDPQGYGRWHVVNTSKPADFAGCTIAMHYGNRERSS